MKFLAVLLLIALVTATSGITLTKEQLKTLNTYITECTKEVKATNETLQKLKRYDLLKPTQNLKCFVNCYLEKSGYLVNGVPQESVIRAKLGPVYGLAMVNKIMPKCNALRGADNCGTAFQIYACYVRTYVALSKEEE